MTKYLIDSCVWIDFFEWRVSSSGRRLGDEANSFIRKVLSRQDTMLFSDVVRSELLGRYGWTVLEEHLAILSVLLIGIKPVELEIDNAEQLSLTRNLGFADCLLAVQARSHHAILITQDKHFQSLKDIATIKRPLEV